MLTLDLMSWFNLRCLFNYTFYTTFSFKCALPVAFMAIVHVLGSIRRFTMDEEELCWDRTTMADERVRLPTGSEACTIVCV